MANNPDPIHREIGRAAEVALTQYVGQELSADNIPEVVSRIVEESQLTLVGGGYFLKTLGLARTSTYRVLDEYKDAVGIRVLSGVDTPQIIYLEKDASKIQEIEKSRKKTTQELWSEHITQQFS